MFALRWSSRLSLQVFATCFLVLFGAAAAGAATPVFVDGAGTCAGQTPCFTTIQAGVNAAGPAPAVVNVFPGTYAESVNLSLMGSAIAGTPGDLALQTLSAAGVPTPGTVSILPAAGTPLLAGPDFPGDIAINGFIVRSANTVGIIFDVTGDLELVEVVADDNAAGGLVAAVGGEFTIIDSSFSDNMGIGINFTGTNAMFDGINVDRNNGTNALFAVTGEARITDSSFSSSVAGAGIIASATNLVLERVTVDGNNDSNAIFQVTGDVRFVDASFSNSVTQSGFFLSEATNFVLERVVVDDNDNANAVFEVSNSLRIANSSFSGSVSGSGLTFASPMQVRLESVVAERNAGKGIIFVAANAAITGSRFLDNGDDGILLGASDPNGAFSLRCSDIAGNDGNGFLTDAGKVNAEQNYWGSPTGPTNPDNPGGTGDSIVSLPGAVDFQPFLTAPAAASVICHPAAAPALDNVGLALSLLALVALAALRLSRRPLS